MTDFQQKCEECDGPIVIDSAHGEPVCSLCGLVVPEMTMVAEEVIAPAPINSNTRTTISQGRDGNGHGISEVKRAELRRIEFVANRMRKYPERVAVRIQAQVGNVASRLQLPDSVRERALFIAKAAHERKMFVGREFSLFVATCVYLAAREQGVTIIPKDLIAVIDTVATNPVGLVFKTFHKLKREFGIQTEQVSAEQILEVMGSRLLNNDRRMMADARVRLSKLRNDHSGAHNSQHTKPEVDVATAIFVTSEIHNLGLTQAAVCSVLKVTDVSLRSRLYDSFFELVRRN